MPIRQRDLPVATFPQRLSTLMWRQDLNQSDVARQVGYTPTAVWNWLQGNTMPRAETLTVLADLLGTTEDWLRDGDAPEADHGPIRDELHDPEVGALKETIAQKVERLRREIAALTGFEQARVKLTLAFESN